MASDARAAVTLVDQDQTMKESSSSAIDIPSSQSLQPNPLGNLLGLFQIPAPSSSGLFMPTASPDSMAIMVMNALKLAAEMTKEAAVAPPPPPPPQDAWTALLTTLLASTQQQQTQSVVSSSSSSSPPLPSLLSSHALAATSLPSSALSTVSPPSVSSLLGAHNEFAAEDESDCKALDLSLAATAEQRRRLLRKHNSEEAEKSGEAATLIVPSDDKEGWCRNKKYIAKTPNGGWMCTVCNKLYGRYNSVSYHVTIYHRNPPIKCDQPGCNFSTREARYIHFHKYYRHGVQLPATIDQGSRRCPCCRHVAKSPAMLEKHVRRHVLSEHGDWRAGAPCSLCHDVLPDDPVPHLMAHARPCQGVRERQLSGCSSSAATPAATSHQAGGHPSASPPTQSLLCPLCATAAPDLVLHLRDVHLLDFSRWRTESESTDISMGDCLETKPRSDTI